MIYGLSYAGTAHVKYFYGPSDKITSRILHFFCSQKPFSLRPRSTRLPSNDRCISSWPIPSTATIPKRRSPPSSFGSSSSIPFESLGEKHRKGLILNLCSVFVTKLNRFLIFNCCLSTQELRRFLQCSCSVRPFLSRSSGHHPFRLAFWLPAALA